MPDYKSILLELIASMGLADNMGDVADDVTQALKKAEITVEPWDDLNDLGRQLAKRGVRTVWGTSLDDDTDNNLDLAPE